MSRILSRLSRNEGQSVVELALVLPLLVLFMLGLVDLSRAIQAYNIVANLSREGANLALRSSLDPQDIMDSLAHTAYPLSMVSNGKMYLTKVEGAEGSQPVIKDKIAWERGSGPDSTVDTAAATKIMASIDIEGKERFYIFEVFYKYDSLFNLNGSLEPYSPQLHSISVLGESAN